LYQISKYNRQQGVKPWPFKKGMKFLNDSKLYMRKIKEIDAKIG